MKGYCQLNCQKPRQLSELKEFRGEEALLICPDCFDKLQDFHGKSKRDTWNKVFKEKKTTEKRVNDIIRTKNRIIKIVIDRPGITAMDICDLMNYDISHIRNILRELPGIEVLLIDAQARNGAFRKTKTYYFRENKQA